MGTHHAPVSRVRVWHAPADDISEPHSRRRKLSATDRHGDKRGSFPTQRPNPIEHGKPRYVPDARDCFPVRLSLKAGKRGAKAPTGIPARVREAFDPYPTRAEIRDQDKAKARRWRELDAEAFKLTGLD